MKRQQCQTSGTARSEESPRDTNMSLRWLAMGGKDTYDTNTACFTLKPFLGGKSCRGLPWQAPPGMSTSNQVPSTKATGSMWITLDVSRPLVSVCNSISSMAGQSSSYSSFSVTHWVAAMPPETPSLWNSINATWSAEQNVCAEQACWYTQFCPTPLHSPLHCGFIIQSAGLIGSSSY